MSPSNETGPARLVLVASRLLLTRRGPAARQTESAVGRHLASVALKQLGNRDPLSGNRGERPTWPAKTRGSISHNRAGLCVAAVSDDSGPELVGVDVEVTSRLEHVATELFTDSTERQQLYRLAQETGDDPLLWKARMFTAKEATWKALASAQSAQRIAVTFNQTGGFTGRGAGQCVDGITVALNGEILAIAIGGAHCHSTTAAWWERLLAMWQHVGPYPSLAEATLPL